MINLCLVVIATQFSETKKREMERMRQERARYTSTSTLASSTNNSEPATCYAEIVKYIAHLWRRFKRRMIKKYRLYKYARCIFNFYFQFLCYTFCVSSWVFNPGLHNQTNKPNVFSTQILNQKPSWFVWLITIDLYRVFIVHWKVEIDNSWRNQFHI